MHVGLTRCPEMFRDFHLGGIKRPNAQPQFQRALASGLFLLAGGVFLLQDHVRSDCLNDTDMLIWATQIVYEEKCLVNEYLSWAPTHVRRGLAKAHLKTK